MITLPIKKHKKRRLRKQARIIIMFIGLIVLGIPLGFVSAYFYSKTVKVTAYDLVVDGEVWFTLSSKEEIQSLLNEHIQTYAYANDQKFSNANISTLQNVEIIQTKVDQDYVYTLEDDIAKLNQIETAANVYIVQKGDNLWNIAIANDIPLSQIIKYNPTIDPDKIWPNNEILFEPENPMLDVSVNYEEKIVEDVMYPTEYIYDDSLYVSQRIVVQKGVMGRQIATYEVTEINGYEEDRYSTQETLMVKPTKAIVRVGTKRTLVRTSSTNFGVTVGRFTSSYGWRVHPITKVRTFHDGIDIAGPIGTNVYAYTDGTVTTVGYDSYYGKYIVINHGGGLTTIYKHLSGFVVKQGAKVKVGDHIGEMGSTGFSTGSHLHFEVRVNGASKNPLDYI